MFLMAKTTSINLRISPELRRNIEMLGEYHGLSMSSYAHSLLVKAVRREMAATDITQSQYEHNANGSVQEIDNDVLFSRASDPEDSAATVRINQKPTETKATRPVKLSDESISRKQKSSGNS